MATQRVKSKNLFNFRPAGVVDADIQAYEEKLQAEMGGSEMEMMLIILRSPIPKFAVAPPLRESRGFGEH